jgi:[ribosomal protein S5]-alanine N-acetyltransferase
VRAIIHKDSMFRLETERLLIRPWQPADRPTFARIHQDPEVTRYTHGGLPYSEDELDEFFARQARQLEQSNLCMGAMVEKASGGVIGMAGVQPLGTTGDLEIGWILARESWGKGYASEAGGAAMRHVLETLGRARVVAIIDLGNVASQRVAARLGMRHDRVYTGVELGHRLPEIVVDLYYRERDGGRYVSGDLTTPESAAETRAMTAAAAAVFAENPWE